MTMKSGFLAVGALIGGVLILPGSSGGVFNGISALKPAAKKQKDEPLPKSSWSLPSENHDDNGKEKPKYVYLKLELLDALVKPCLVTVRNALEKNEIATFEITKEERAHPPSFLVHYREDKGADLEIAVHPRLQPDNDESSKLWSSVATKAREFTFTKVELPGRFSSKKRQLNWPAGTGTTLIHVKGSTEKKDKSSGEVIPENCGKCNIDETCSSWQVATPPWGFASLYTRLLADIPSPFPFLQFNFRNDASLNSGLPDTTPTTTPMLFLRLKIPIEGNETEEQRVKNNIGQMWSLEKRLRKVPGAAPSAQDPKMEFRYFSSDTSSKNPQGDGNWFLRVRQHIQFNSKKFDQDLVPEKGVVERDSEAVAALTRLQAE